MKSNRERRVELTDFQRALLAIYSEPVAGERYGPLGRSPYDIEKWLNEGGNILGYSASQVYKQTKELAEEGYLEAFAPQNLTRGRTYYELTDKGRAELKWWYHLPAPPPPFDAAQAFIRLRGAGSSRVDVIADGLLLGRDEVECQLDDTNREQNHLKRIGALDAAARLRLDLRRSLLLAYWEWLERVDAEWGPKADEDEGIGNGLGAAVDPTRRPA